MSCFSILEEMTKAINVVCDQLQQLTGHLTATSLCSPLDTTGSFRPESILNSNSNQITAGVLLILHGHTHVSSICVCLVALLIAQTGDMKCPSCNLLCLCLQSQKDPMLVEKIMNDLDSNKDNEVDFNEFVVLVAALTVACNDFFQEQKKKSK